MGGGRSGDNSERCLNVVLGNPPKTTKYGVNMKLFIEEIAIVHLLVIINNFSHSFKTIIIMFILYWITK